LGATTAGITRHFFHGDDENPKPDTALSLARTIVDDALHAAKREGRDRIVATPAADADGGPSVGSEVESGIG
jgi:hypothetical protein